MKLNKLTILIFCLLIVASIAHSAERASISATATVIPMLGVMPTSDLSQNLTFTETSESKLLIQAPKNSALYIHILGANHLVRRTGLLTYKSSDSLNSLTQENSISDFYSYDISKFQSSNQQPQILTILRIDN